MLRQTRELFVLLIVLKETMCFFIASNDKDNIGFSSCQHLLLLALFDMFLFAMVYYKIVFCITIVLFYREEKIGKIAKIQKN